jgi:predicted transport protein
MLKMESRNLYGFNRRSYWLRRFENFDRKERVQVQDYTIEHIMPQNEALRPEWRADLGEDWQRIRNQYLHTLGNLTLTGYNSEYSDRPFKEKRDMKGGFRESPLKLNQGLGTCEVWNEAAIRERADRLAAMAAQIWSAPAIGESILYLYRPQEKVATNYTRGDHPYLNSGLAHELFEAFRKEVLSLDECVHEEFWKLYIAYKAETNFVDVIPQQKRLILSLNIPFASIEDPRKICRDVTNLGRWGNGDVEVFLDRLEDVPYVVGLTRQALEEQLGDEDRPGAD